MNRPTYPVVGGMVPTGRRLETADCNHCDWTYEAEAPIQQAARQHVRSTAHTVRYCRALEYSISPASTSQEQAQHG